MNNKSKQFKKVSIKENDPYQRARIELFTDKSSQYGSFVLASQSVIAQQLEECSRIYWQGLYKGVQQAIEYAKTKTHEELKSSYLPTVFQEIFGEEE